MEELNQENAAPEAAPVAAPEAAPVAKSVTAPKPAPAAAKTAELYIGVNLEIQGRDIMLAPKTPINQIAEKGIELELPNDLYLGKAKEILDGIAEEFGYNSESNTPISETKTDITVIDKLIDKVMNAELTISDLYIKVHPDPKDDANTKLVPAPDVNPNGTGKYYHVDAKGKANTNAPVTVTETKGEYFIDNKKLSVPPKPTEYTVGLKATWSGNPGDKLGSKFKLKGLYLMITNEDLSRIEARRLKQKSLASNTGNAKK